MSEDISSSINQISYLWKRIKKNIRNSIIVSNKNPKTKNYLKSHNAILNERKRHAESKNFVYIHQFSIFRMWWEVIMTIVYLLFYIMVPMRLSFILRKEMNLKLIDIAILITEIFFLLDIFLTFLTGMTLERSRVILLDKKQVAKTYILGYFFIDLVTSFPTDTVALMCFTKYNISFLYIQIISLLKIFRYSTFTMYFACFSEMFLKCFPIKYSRRLVDFILFFNSTICLFNVFGTAMINTGHLEDHLWTLRLENSDSLIVKYYYGLFFSLVTFSTCGYGTIPPIHVGEIIITMLIMLATGIFKIYLCAAVNEEIQGDSNVSNEYLGMISQIEEYMKYKQLPELTQKRFLEYFDYRFQKRYFKEEYLLSALSEHLRSEVTLDTCKNLVKSEIFQDVSQLQLGCILSKLNYEVYLPGDIIARASSLGDCMYFISNGTVAVFSPTGKEIFHLDDGDYFGEVSLIMKDNKRIATVVALETTELFRMDRSDFRELIATNPIIMKKIESTATTRMNKTILAEKVHSQSRGFYDD